MVVNARSEKDVSFCIVILYSLEMFTEVFAVLSVLVHSGSCLQCYDPADLSKGTVFLFFHYVPVSFANCM